MSEHIEKLLSEYMDEELDELEKQKVDKHLAICSDCNDRLNQLMSLRKEILAAYLPIQLPTMIEEKIMEKIQRNSLKRSAGVLNTLAIMMLCAIGIMLLVTTSPFLSVGLPIFHSIYSIASGLIYAVPSIISSIPYVAGILIAFFLCFIFFAIFALRYLVHTMGKTVRAEDI